MDPVNWGSQATQEAEVPGVFSPLLSTSTVEVNSGDGSVWEISVPFRVMEQAMGDILQQGNMIR